MALICWSLLSVCCEARETDDLGSQEAVELQHTAVYLSSLLSHPFDHAAFKACRDQKERTLYTLQVSRERAVEPSERCTMEKRKSSKKNNFRPSVGAIRSCLI